MQDHCVLSPSSWTPKADGLSPYGLWASASGAQRGHKSLFGFDGLVKHPQIRVDLKAAFLKLEIPAGFVSLIFFQIFVLLVLLAPSLHLLSPDAGVSKMQCRKLCNALINLAIFNCELTSFDNMLQLALRCNLAAETQGHRA